MRSPQSTTNPGRHYPSEEDQAHHYADSTQDPDKTANTLKGSIVKTFRGRVSGNRLGHIRSN
jgi:hypothetical protein